MNSEFESERHQMVRQHIAPHIRDQRIIAAMQKVPRHRFVSEELQEHAYENRPLPIAGSQSISQPFIVAYMSELLEPKSDHKILEIGTGSAYQSAVLAELVSEVYSVEILEELAQQARELLKELGYTNVHVQHSDGFDGWRDKAPFDGIIVTAASPSIPRELVKQLKIGGKLVMPLGAEEQELIVLEKAADHVEETLAGAVRFVPMTGQIREEQ